MFYLFYSYFLSRTAFNVAFKTKLTHYETLGLSPTATTRDIREAFIRLSKQVHNFTLRFRFNGWVVSKIILYWFNRGIQNTYETFFIFF